MLRPNPYYVEEEASDYDVPQEAGDYDVPGMVFGVSGRGDQRALQGAQKYRAPKGLLPPIDVYEKKIDDYKNKIYGFLLDKTRLPPENVQADLLGAKSFSIGYDTEFLCENIRFFTSHLRDHADSIKSRQLTITDAGCGCAGDSMQFLVAEYRDPASPDAPAERIFSQVTGVDIHLGRKQMAEANFRAVETAYHTTGKVRWEVLLGNYKHLMKDLRQDIVYIDPPWQGRSGESMVHEEVFLWSDDTETQDKDFGVDGILKALIEQNNAMHGEDERNRTRMLIVKTPPHWRCKMLH